jgi:hypothetical protein
MTAGGPPVAGIRRASAGVDLGVDLGTGTIT